MKIKFGKNQNEYDALSVEECGEPTLQWLSCFLNDLRRLGTDKVKYVNHNLETTLHAWYNREIDAVLTYEKNIEGMIISREMILNVSKL